ncbi:MAG: sigma-70 family RNA polymerase sigma factor [Bacteroidota bacterium]
MTDQSRKYLQGLKSGDQQILHEIYSAHFPRIKDFVLKNAGSAAEAEDVFQEGIMTLYQMALKPEFVLKSQFFTLLYAICRNWWLRQLRKNKKVTFEDTEILIAEEPKIIEAMAKRARQNLYNEKFKLLGLDCQKLLSLAFGGAGIKEIMQKMQLSSEGYTRKRKFMCKKTLFKLVQEDPRYQELRFDGGTDPI